MIVIVDGVPTEVPDVPTTQEPLTLAQAKAHLRLGSDTTEDELISGLIVAAREWVEAFTSLILTQREITQVFNGFSCRLRLYAWPIASDAEVAVLYRDYTGASQTITDARLARSARWAQVLPAIGTSWPSIAPDADAVSVTVVAGYPTPEAVPQSLKQAMLLLISTWFNEREAKGEAPTAVEMLCHSFRLIGV
tara:strand:+ start:13302 stop:13880 length:579 start_codon:yes stop_codon:yes gene_type:complete